MSLTITVPLHAERTFNEGLKVDVDYKNLYKIYDKSLPSMIDTNTAINMEFYEDSGGSKNNTPFINTTGYVYIADQNNFR